jgi:hypothetical protein
MRHGIILRHLELITFYLKTEFKVFSAPNPETLIVPAKLFKPGPVDGKQTT